MPFDAPARQTVAWLVFAAWPLGLTAAACGPAVRTDGSLDEPTPARSVTPPRTAAPARQGVVIGEMCPTAAAGRAAVAPLVVRGLTWTGDPAAVGEALTRGQLGVFSVLSFQGRRVAGFSVAGAADAGLPQDVAAGSLVGGSPCSFERAGSVAEDPACNQATRGCGLALARLGADADEPELRVGGLCVAGDLLAVDLDGDGTTETFALADLLDGAREPAEELSAAPVVAPACAARFSWYGLALNPSAERATAPDPRYQVRADVLGVIDVDLDGRHELVIALTYPESRTVVVYAAQGSANRLELVAEAVAWPAP